MHPITGRLGHVTVQLVRSSWGQEWGGLVLAALMALPLFTPRVYASDEVKYFVTLRSIYMDRDLHYANEYGHFVTVDPVAHAGLVPYRDGTTITGYRLNDAPIGTAILWAPFYAAADGVVTIARALGSRIPRDGYSRPYVWAVCIASLVWGLAGLALVYRLCRAYVGRAEATWGVLGVWFASPVVFYLYITPAMAHASSLFAVALYLWVWHRTRRQRTFAGWIGLGLTAGLMVLVRELNWLGLLVAGVDELWGVGRAGGGRLQDTAVELFRRIPGYAVFASVMALVVAPQFYVYHTLNGTYGPTPFVVDKFAPLPVYALDVLFSGFHGLFSWHPITLVGIVGLVALAYRAPAPALALLAFFVAQVLVVGSYDTWWGGASFGARRFVNCTALFALGTAVALDMVRPRRGMAATGIVLLIAWNAGLAIQYATGLIPRDAPVRMSRIMYNQVFEVPPRLGDIAWRFVVDRSSFYRTRSVS